MEPGRKREGENMNTEDETEYCDCVPLWMTAALVMGVWAIALAIVALAWEVAR